MATLLPLLLAGSLLVAPTLSTLQQGVLMIYGKEPGATSITQVRLAGSVFICSLHCQQHPTCGNIIWDEAQPDLQRCQIVIGFDSELGTEAPPTATVFRMGRIDNKLIFLNMPGDPRIWTYCQSRCPGLGGQMYPVPTTEKDIAIMASYARIFLDAVREKNDEQFYTIGGEELPLLDASYPHWVPSFPVSDPTKKAGVQTIWSKLQDVYSLQYNTVTPTVCACVFEQ